MKSVCIQRPNVMKHFQQLLLKKDGEGIKVLMDAPEFFDEGSLNSNNDSNDTDETPLNDDADAHIKSINHTIAVDDIKQEGDDPAPFIILALHDNEEHDVCDRYGMKTLVYDDVNMEHVYDDVNMDHVKSLTFDHELPSVKLLGSTHMVQVDGGADRSTTPHRELVHEFRPPNESLGEKTIINDAGVHPHRIIGYGHFKVRCFDKDSNPVVVKVPCACIPSIPSTLLNFRNMPNLLHVEETSNVLLNVAQAILHVTDCNDNPCELRVPLLLRGTRLYVNTLIPANSPSTTLQHRTNGHVCRLPPLHHEESIHVVSDEPSKLLWHARLGHLNFRALADMHRFATGVP